MANFNEAFEKMIANEGGYVLHNVSGDNGGMTYAGIARKFNLSWAGWSYLDRGNTPPSDMVREFYDANYWKGIRGDLIDSQRVAESIFDFYVNAGTPAKKLAQIAVGATPDGIIGPETIALINETDEERFIMAYTLAKIARYRDIVMNNRQQGKFLLGWINRALRGLK